MCLFCSRLPCKDCGKPYETHGGMTYHVNSVHKQIRYACHLCERSFSHKGTLRMHLEEKHGKEEMKHVCKDCGNVFGSKHRLLSHIARHHGEATFKCQVCEKQFAMKTSLNIHTKTVHHTVAY